jgi:hypothetical protein
MLQLSSTQVACVLEPLLSGINNHICVLQLNGWLLRTLNISYVMLQSTETERHISVKHDGPVWVMYNARLHSTTLLPRAPTALSAIFAHKIVPREANTAFFRLTMLSQDLRSVLRDILMVVWVNSLIICPPAHFPLMNVKGQFTNSTSVHLYIFHCWTARDRSQTLYICPPAHFPLLNVKGQLTSSIHLSTFTFPTVEPQGATHTLDTSVHLYISHCWTSRGHSQARYICPPLHFPLLNVKGPLTTSIHLSTCTFPTVERQGASSQARYICPPLHFPLLNVNGPFTNSIYLSTCTFSSVDP